MSKPDFAAGLKSLKPQPTHAPEPEEPARKSARAPSREGKVSIGAYFEPEVRKQFAILAVRQDTTQTALLAEAINLVFEKYGESPIARG